jgi:HK97 family phage major capsid protein
MINQDVTPQLIQMNLGVGTGGQLTYMPPGGLSQTPYGSLFGAPVIEIEQCPTLGTVGDIALCAWSEYQAIEKGGIQTASSIHVRFIFDETVLTEAPLAA